MVRPVQKLGETFGIGAALDWSGARAGVFGC
jgi:hypothetical protein